MCYAATIELPCTTLGDYWPPSSDLNGKILFGPIQFRDSTTGDLSDPSTTLDRVVVTMSNSKSRNKFIIDSENESTRNAEVVITQPTGAWEFEIPHISNFLPAVGNWSVDIAIYHGGSASPLTIYTSTVTVNSDV